VKKPVNASSDWKAVFTWQSPPSVSSGAVLAPTDGGCWMVTIAEYHQGEPIETWDGFLRALQQLATPTIFEAVRSILVPESIWNYGFPTSIWRHFERLPLGVLPIADSLCRLNPFHGYGMSVAAQQARLLQILLEGAAEKVDPLAAVSTDF